jgi:hypothetical protein
MILFVMLFFLLILLLLSFSWIQVFSALSFMSLYSEVKLLYILILTFL